MSTLPTDRISSHNNTFVESHHSSSSAEQTIVTHSNPEAMVNERPLAVKKDGFSYPQNPTNGYISRWRDGFRGCLSCGSDTHRFASCTSRSDPTNKLLFWKELWAHVPTTRKKKSEPIHQSLIDADPSCSPSNKATANCIQTDIAPNPRKRLDNFHGTKSTNNSSKEARFHAIFVHVNNVSSNAY